MNVRLRSSVGAGIRDSFDVTLGTKYREFLERHDLADASSYTIVSNGTQLEDEDLDTEIPPDALISVVPSKIDGAAIMASTASLATRFLLLGALLGGAAPLIFALALLFGL